MFEASVDRLGGPIAGAGLSEVGQDVVGTLLQRPAECDNLAQSGRDTVADRLDELDYQLTAVASVLVTVAAIIR